MVVMISMHDRRHTCSSLLQLPHNIVLVSALANGCNGFAWQLPSHESAVRNHVHNLSSNGPIFMHANCVSKKSIFSFHPRMDVNGVQRNRLDWSGL